MQADAGMATRKNTRRRVTGNAYLAHSAVIAYGRLCRTFSPARLGLIANVDCLAQTVMDTVTAPLHRLRAMP